jgi:hypothetical protein
MHRWTEQDDLMILFVFKFGFDRSPLTKQQLVEHIGTSVGSVRWRLGNFAAIEGKGTADHYALLSRSVYKKYVHLSFEELKNLAFPDGA